jgi:hypothetical protein
MRVHIVSDCLYFVDGETERRGTGDRKSPAPEPAELDDYGKTPMEQQ